MAERVQTKYTVLVILTRLNITGGTGNDTLYASTTKGSNTTFNFTAGDGKDTVYSGNGEDTLRFTGEITNITTGVSANKKDLIINYTENDSVTIKDYYTVKKGQITGVNPKNSVKYVQLGNIKTELSVLLNNNFEYVEIGGNKIGIATLISSDFISGDEATLTGSEGANIILGTNTTEEISGGLGNDILIGGSDSSTTFVFTAGDGHDTLFAGGGNDTIKINGVPVTDLEFTQGTGDNACDLIIGYNHDEEVAQDSVTIKNYFDENGVAISSVKAVEVGGKTFPIENIRAVITNIKSSDLSPFNGTDEAELMIPVGTNQTINAGAGNDIILVGDGTYVTLYAGEGDDIVYTGNQGYYYLKQGNNTVYSGTRGSSKYIYFGEGNDTMYTSSDTGWSGDLYYITEGSVVNGGHDVMYWGGHHSGQGDMLDFVNTQFDNMVFTRNEESDDLVIRYGNDNDVTLKDFYKEGNEQWGSGDMVLMAKAGTGNTGWLSLNNAIAQKGGVKTSYFVGTDDAETIDGTSGADAFIPGGGNDIINLGDGNDILLAGSGDKTVTATSGDNIINLGSGNNNVTLGNGSDTVNSGVGTNTIRFAHDDTGNDTYKYANGTDSLIFNGESLSDLSINTTGTDVILTRSNGKTLTMQNLPNLTTGLTIYDGTNASSTLFNLSTTAGSLTAALAQTITTGNGNDTVSVGLGNDTINVGTGTNTITLSALADADNNDTYTYAGGIDTFVLPVADFSTFKMLRAGDDLIVGYNGDTANNTLTIKNYYNNTDMSDSINFTAGDVTSTLTDLIEDKGINAPIIGTDANETLGNALFEDNQTIYGMGGNDTLNGGSGDDYLVGGTSSDTLNGGNGDDTYFIDEDDWGDGQDVITDTAGNDSLKINTTADKINLFFDVSLNKDGDEVVMNGTNATYTKGNDLYICKDNGFTLDNVRTYGGAKIVNYFTEGGAIERVQIPDNSNWGNAFNPELISLTAQKVANWLNDNGFDSTGDAISTGTDGQKEVLNLYKPFVSSDNINATNLDDIIITTGMNKNIRSYDGNDVIYVEPNKGAYVYAGNGDDIIYTGKSGSYYTGSGDNTVYVGQRGGSKYIYFGEGNDTIYTSTDTAWNGDLYYITDSTYAPEGGHDVMYWGGPHGGQGDMLCFYNTQFDDMAFTRNSDDLVIKYGNNNDLTLKDYYKAGNEQWANSNNMVVMAGKGNGNTNWLNLNDATTQSGGLRTVIYGLTGTEANEYIKGTAGNDVITSNGGNDHLNGGAGDDTYNVASLSDRTTIFDSAGDDILNIGANKDGINIIFNVTKAGTFNSDNNRVYFVDDETFNSWKTSGTHPADGINISGFSSIETINSADGYKIADLGQLKSDVASWLSTANGGAGYSDVVTALKSGNDVSELIAIFNRDANWVENA